MIQRARLVQEGRDSQGHPAMIEKTIFIYLIIYLFILIHASLNQWIDSVFWYKWLNLFT